MFIRTRDKDGFVFYLGSDPHETTMQDGSTDENVNKTSLKCLLQSGKLFVKVGEVSVRISFNYGKCRGDFQHFLASTKYHSPKF